MEEEKKCTIKNRSASVVVYRIPEQGIRREFQPFQVRQIPKSELEQLTYQPGGIQILANFLQINEENVKNLGMTVEPEYNMSEQDVVKLIKEGSLDAFLDALDFAPIGVIDLIKNFAVSLPMQDAAKRDALKEKTGFDVSKALEHLKEANEEGNAVTTTTSRRVQPEATSAAPTARRTSGQNYKIVSK